MERKVFLFLQKILSNRLWPFLWLCTFFGAFYYFTAPMLWLEIQNHREASLLWSDEGLHLKSIERMQSQQTWELLHPAYTAFYSNLSYAFSFLINGFEEKISTGSFIIGSRWVSYLCIQGMMVIVFWRLNQLLGSWKWAFLGMCFVGMQRGSYFFSITMHPESPMLLGLVIAIFSATEYLLRQRFLFLFLMAFGVALSISSKLQTLLLLPWALIIFLLGLWIGRKKDLYRIFLWSMGFLITLVCTMFLLTPYQIFNFHRLWNGIQAERSVGAAGGWGDTNANINLFDWINYALSNELVGYSYSLLLTLALFSFFKKLFQYRLKIREFLSRPEYALFFTNLIWVLIGAGYVFFEVESLISRYLIHVAPSLMLMTFLGVYFIFFIPKNISQYVFITLLTFLVGIGIQQQTKHGSFDFKVRKRVASRFFDIRELMDELKNIVPKESHILNPHGLQIDSKWFNNSYFDQPTRLLISESKIEYLLIPESYPGSLKPEGVSLQDSKNSLKYREKINFWNDLVNNGIDGQFEIMRHFRRARVKLFQRKSYN